MLAICTATSQFASLKSKHLKALVAICSEVCEDCVKECQKIV